MSVTRYFYKKLEDGSMSETPTHLGAKAEYVTIKPAEGEELLNAQSEFQRMWQMDTYLENKINTEITDRKNAITEEATARQNADATLQTNINAEAEARAAAVKAEQEAREAAVTAEQEAREADINDVLQALATEVTDRQTAINSAIRILDEDLQEQIDTNKANINTNTSNININATAISNNTTAIAKNASSIEALKEVLLYTSDTEVSVITEDTVLNLSEASYTYILIYCEYNGKRMPVYQVLADGASSEVIYHSLTEDGVCYIGMNMLVSENTLAISNIINSNDTAEFKILNIYGCV